MNKISVKENITNEKDVKKIKVQKLTRVKNDNILELLKGLVVQVEAWVSSQVQFLKLGRQILW